jgi:hypothetical protein
LTTEGTDYTDEDEEFDHGLHGLHGWKRRRGSLEGTDGWGLLAMDCSLMLRVFRGGWLGSL